MKTIPKIIDAVRNLTPEQMLFIVTLVALVTVGLIAFTALKGRA